MRFKQFYLSETKQYFYKGNCVNSFDDDGKCLLNIFTDVSDFANTEENSKSVSKTKNISKLNLSVPGLQDIANKKTTTLLYSKDSDMYFLYDVDKDIHYFFTAK